nr:MAG TPA: hypothetical protein [Caudoviricetes sp.]
MLSVHCWKNNREEPTTLFLFFCYFSAFRQNLLPIDIHFVL